MDGTGSISMTAAFLRLALVTAASGYVLALVELAQWQHPGVALIVGVVGVVVALTVTVEDSAQPEPEERPARRRLFGDPRTKPYDGIDS